MMFAVFYQPYPSSINLPVLVGIRFSLHSILHNVGLRMFNANLYPDIVYRNTRFYKAEMDARKICYAFTDKVKLGSDFLLPRLF